jgi:nucleotide-binding universal stress UspA family protein
MSARNITQHTLSPTEQVVRAAEVLRALGTARKEMMRHILFATDGSDSATCVADVAAELARAARARLSILTVKTDARRKESSARQNVNHAVNADRILRCAKERAQEYGVSDVRVKLARGDPAEVIIKSVRRSRVDAIVMGRRGRGLVSQKVASLAPCIVIVVPCT